MMWIKRYRTAAAIASVSAIGAGALVLAQSKGPVAGGPKGPAGDRAVTVYKSPTCGCCSVWVEHLRAAGFRVEAQDVSDEKLEAVAREAGVTRELSSCHTAKVGGYTVEGHVPVADIEKMLKEKPAIAGIAAPGMPLGSPGMEAGGQKQPYDVIAFTKDGKKVVFAKH